MKSSTIHSIIFQRVFQKLKTWIFFFCLLNCEKFDACILQCIFPDQFILKLGRIYEGEFERVSVHYELQFRKYSEKNSFTKLDNGYVAVICPPYLNKRKSYPI